MTLGRDAARGGVISLVSQGIRFVLNVGSTAVLARLLDISDFGVFAIAIAYTMVLARFRDGGLRLANVQAATLTNGQATTLLLINVGLGLSLGFVILGLAPVLAWAYGEPAVLQVLVVLALSYIIGSLGVQSNGILHRRMQLGVLSAIEVAAMSVSVAVGIGTALGGAGVLALAFAHLSLNATKTVLSVFLARWMPSHPAPFREVKPMIKFGAALAMSGAVNQTGANADRALLGAFDTVATGLYGKALNLATLPLERISPAFAEVAIPTLSRFHDQPDAYRRAYDRLLSGLTLLTVPIACVLLLEADAIVLLVLGEKWTGAVPIFRWLCLGSILLPLWNSIGWLFVSQGRGGEMFKWHLIDSVAKIVAALIAVWWGATGLAIAFSLRYVVLIPFLFGLVGVTGPIDRPFLYRHMASSLTLAVPGLAVAVGVIALVRAFGHTQLVGMGGGVYLFVFLGTVLASSTLRDQARYFTTSMVGRLMGEKRGA